MGRGTESLAVSTLIGRRCFDTLATLVAQHDAKCEPALKTFGATPVQMNKFFNLSQNKFKILGYW